MRQRPARGADGRPVTYNATGEGQSPFEIVMPLNRNRCETRAARYRMALRRLSNGVVSGARRALCILAVSVADEGGVHARFKRHPL